MFDERTEPATPRRRRRAREQGQVARSAELVAAVILLGVLWAAPALMPRLGRQLSDFFIAMLAAAGHEATDGHRLGSLAGRSLLQVGLVAGPVLGVVAGGALVTNLLQVGWHVSAAQLQPKLSRLNPLVGLQRLFTARSAVELLKGLMKIGVVAWIGWRYCVGNQAELLRLSGTFPDQIAPRIGALAHGMAFRMAAALTVLAALDYAYQRWQFERSLRMTKQEVRDELKETEGNPEIKARIRQRQRELARRRMMVDVARAAVVITNPTHYAVALSYEMGKQSAPIVVAKGRALIAERIREVARAHGVPTVENPPLARSLYRWVGIGDEIPPALYRAVAEVLALVWRLDARRRA